MNGQPELPAGNILQRGSFYKSFFKNSVDFICIQTAMYYFKTDICEANNIENYNTLSLHSNIFFRITFGIKHMAEQF